MGYERPGPKKFQGPICARQTPRQLRSFGFPFLRLCTLPPFHVITQANKHRLSFTAEKTHYRRGHDLDPANSQGSTNSVFRKRFVAGNYRAAYRRRGRPTRPGAISLLRGSQPAGLRAPARAKPLIARALRFADLLDIGRGRPGLRRAAAEPGRPRRVCRRNHPPPQPRRHAASGDGSPRAMSGRQRVKTGVSPQYQV